MSERVSDGSLRDLVLYPRGAGEYTVSFMASELLAARERLRELEPRPLREGDLFETPMGNIFTAPQPGYLAAHRIVRVPIPSAAAPPAEEREDVAPNTDPAKCAWNTDGYWCHAGTCKVCDDRYDAGERSGWAKPLPAEPAEKDVRDRNGVSFNYHYKSQPATGFDVEKIPAELRALRDEVAEIKAKIGGCT